MICCLRRHTIAGLLAGWLWLPITAGAALIDVVGTNGADFLGFVGSVTAVSATLEHPTGRRPAAINGTFNVSRGRYDGRGGTDTLVATNGGDWLKHGAAEPTLISVERVAAGDGDDVVEISAPVAGASYALIDAGRGNDIVMYGAAVGVVVNLRDGDDLVGWSGAAEAMLFGMEGNDRFWSGLGGNDFVDGGDGDDVLSLLVAAWGNDLYVGGEGEDSIDFGDLELADFDFGWFREPRWSALAWAATPSFEGDCMTECLVAWHRPSGSALGIHVPSTEALLFGARTIDLRDPAQLASLLAGAPAQPVPAPGSLGLAALGAMAMLRIGRRLPVSRRPRTISLTASRAIVPESLRQRLVCAGPASSTRRRAWRPGACPAMPSPCTFIGAPPPAAGMPPAAAPAASRHRLRSTPTGAV